MKKTLTLLFLVGMATASFAQSNRHGQYQNAQTDNRNHSSGYSGNNNRGYNQTNQGNSGYYGNNTNQGNNGYHGNDQAENRNHENGYDNNQGANFREGNDDRGFHGEFHDNGRDRRMSFDRFHNDRNRSWLRIRFEKHGYF